MDTPQSREENATSILDYLQDQATRVHKIYEPQWNARTDLLKTIISISSASIVLSVTFSSSLRALKLNPNWSRLVVFAFVLLVISLIVAFFALWIGTRVYGVQSGVLDARLQLREAAMRPAEESIEALKGIYCGAINSVVIGDKIAARLVPISSISFCLAITILAIVGAKEILS